MKFVDIAKISIKSGDGGKGSVSFRRELYVPKGGPDGGDGGKGGDVILKVDTSLQTLLDFKYKPIYEAKRGGYGLGSDKTGAGSDPLIIRVPPGTSVFDLETDNLIADLTGPGQTFVAARGGRGGKGNAFFKSSTNRSPRMAQPGEPGEEKMLRLELKLIADVGLVGLPNAGKSTLISRISAAKPKIADYPFTTLVPNLGVVKAGEGSSFVVADLPGLIEGASQGHGLGHQFLKHIERTRIILHLLDCQQPDPIADLQTINGELAAFDASLLDRPQIVVITKADLVADVKELTPLKKKIKKLGFDTVVISAVSGKGLAELVRKTAEKLKELKGPAPGPVVEDWEP